MPADTKVSESSSTGLPLKSGPPQSPEGDLPPRQELSNALRDPKRRFLFSSHARLADALPPYTSSLYRLITSTCPEALHAKTDGGDCAWATHAIMLVEHAQKAADVGRADLGWKCLHEAQRMEVFALRKLADQGDRSPLLARARSIALEGEQKLKGWRKNTVKQLLGGPDNPNPDPHVSEITESHLILTESFSNMYIKMRSQRWQVGILAVIATALLGSWWVWVGPGILALPVLSGAATSVGNPLLATILVFGGIGAAISGIVSLARKPPATIPEQLTNWTVTLARVVVGVVAALIVFVALESTLLENANGRLILLQSFVAGFSERLLSAAVESGGG